MIKTLLRPWPTRLLLMRISKWVILITLALSIMIAGVSIYAENVGNFVISINRSSGNTLLLSENGNFDGDNGTIILFARSLENLDNATYADTPSAGIPNKDSLYGHNGNHSDLKFRRYFAYSFYIKNVSGKPLDYNMTLNINDKFKEMDEALRIQITRLEMDELGNWITNPPASEHIYAKQEKEKTECPRQPANPNMYDNNIKTDLNPVPYVTYPFYDYDVICSEDVEQIGVNEVYKYVILIWLEGNDPDCVDSLQGGMIRMTMNFEQTSPVQ